MKGRLILTREEKARLARLGKNIGPEALRDVSHIVTPGTVLRWYRQLIARKFDGSARRHLPRGRRPVSAEKENLVCRMALENLTWGYTHIKGAMENLGHTIGRSTIKRILKRNGIPPAPKRGRESHWHEFITSHMHDTVATDFFTVEVVTPRALVTLYVLFFVHHATRRVLIAGITTNPDAAWMMQIARNVTMDGMGFLSGMKYLIHDNDGKFCPAFDKIIEDSGIELVPLPPRSPNLNAFAERFVLSVKSECLWKLLVFDEQALWQTVMEYAAHYHCERNHQGLRNTIPFPEEARATGEIECRERLGGVLKYYCRKSA